MKSLLIKILLLSFTVSANLVSQPLRNYETGFQTIFDKTSKVNPYYFSGNPAYLDYEISGQLLSLKSDYYNESGEFRRAVDPGNIRNYSLTASGKKEIDSSQIFKGSFSFLRKENNKWQWIFSKDYSGNSPFLIGDSTTGDSRLHGILMNAEYRNTLFEKVGLGLAVSYSVDQGLKQVSPRPTSKNREFNFTAGLNYNLMEYSSLGLKAAVYDNVETINYREDVGALTTETIIFKFRGYDLPNVFRKKTETRYAYNNGYSAGVDFLIDYPDMLKLNIAGSAGFNKINVKDDPINPVSDGFWKMNFYQGGIVLSSPLSRRLTAGLTYSMKLSEDWAENLNYQVLYVKNKDTENSLFAGIEYLFGERISGGVEAGYGYFSRTTKDYYSVVNAVTRSSFYSLKLGFKSGWTENTATFISAGIISCSINEKSIETPAPTGYFTDFRNRDIIFYQTPGNRYLYNFILSYMPPFGGELLLNLIYSVNISGESAYFSDMKRDVTNISLEYRVKAF